MARYHYREGVTLDKKKSRWFLIVIGIILFAAALYVVAVYLAPHLVTVPFTNLTSDATSNKIKNSKAGQFGDRLYLPQINVDVAIAEGGDKSALEVGAWQRNTDLGDPAKGGNFALSAPKFTFDTTPWWTRAKSPFYNLDKLQQGDQITVDYKNSRFLYEVEKKYDATSVEGIEQKTDAATLTLYATDGRGDPVGGHVVQAKLLGPSQKSATLESQSFSE